MKNAYHDLVLPAFGAIGGYRLMRRLCRRSALVLAYHGVMDDGDPSLAVVNKNHVSASAFRWQMEHLRRHYSVVELPEIVRRVRESAPLAGLAAVTFDDGYRNVGTVAAPILCELGLPATVFLIADLVGSQRLTWYDRVELCVRRMPGPELLLEDERFALGEDREPVVRRVKALLKARSPDLRDAAIAQLEARAEVTLGDGAAYGLMDWPEILELQRRGLAFGVHSASHTNLTQVDSRGLDREIDESICVISRQLEVPVPQLCFSYPDGDVDQRVRDRVARTGVCGAVAVGHRLVSPHDDPFALPRVTVDRNQSPVMFEDVTVGLTRRIKKILPVP